MTRILHRTPLSERAPSVLVVLVARTPPDWLRGCLSALAAQTYPRMGVLAVDNASSDGSIETARSRRSATGASLASDRHRGLAGRSVRPPSRRPCGARPPTTSWYCTTTPPSTPTR